MDSKHTIIFGATGFLGHKIAYNLASYGNNLILVYNENAIKAQELKDSLEKLYKISCYIFKCNIINEFEVTTLYKNIREQNLYINNMIFAATNSMSRSSIEDTDSEHWRLTIQIGLIGLYLCSKEMCKQCKPTSTNRILIISSTSAIGGMPYLTDYASVKSAQIGFAKSLALEGANNKLLVNVIAPGLIAESENGNGASERVSSSPLKRLTEVEDVLNMVNFFLSMKSDSLTGQVIVLDAGNDARYRYILE